MVTLVGTQEDFIVALKGLVELEYSAVEAYIVAMDKLENAKFKTVLNEFKANHEAHIHMLTHYLEGIDQNPPRVAGFGQTMTVDHSLIKDLNNDESILKALIAIENDADCAYERMNTHVNKIAEISNSLKTNWQNVSKHKTWIEETINDIIKA